MFTRTHFSPFIATLAIATVAIGVAGCGSALPRAVDETGAISIEGNSAKSYRSVADLLRDSAAVVVGVADPAPEQVPAWSDGTVTYYDTVTKFKVERVVSGRVPRSKEMAVRQSGVIQYTRTGFSPLLVPGHRYLLFVTPFETRRGLPTGNYVITGDAGEFVPVAHSYVLASQNVDRDSFPRSITVNDIVGAD